MYIIEVKTKRGYTQYVQAMGLKRGIGFSNDSRKARKFSEAKAAVAAKVVREMYGEIYAVSVQDALLK